MKELMRDAVNEILHEINGLFYHREDLITEKEEKGIKRRFKFYVVYLRFRGVNPTALIDTAAEVTCISEEFLKENVQIFREYPILPPRGIAVEGPVGGKIIKI